MPSITQEEFEEILKISRPGVTPQNLQASLARRGYNIGGQGSAVDVPTPQQPEQEGFGKAILQSTVGGRGILGFGKLAGQAIAQPTAIREKIDLYSRITDISNQTTELIRKRRTASLEEQGRLNRMINSNSSSLADLHQAQQGFDQFLVTPKEAAGRTINTMLTIGAFAPQGIGGLGSVLRLMGVKSGHALLLRSAENALLGVGFSVGASLSEDRTPTKGEIAAGAVIGGVIPLGGSASKNVVRGTTKALTEKLPRALIGDLVRPIKGSLSYGKDPVRGILRERITANNIEELESNIINRRNAIGIKINNMIAENPVHLDLRKALIPIDAALEKAKRNPRTNAALIKRLEEAKADLLKIETGVDGKIVQNRELSNMTSRQAFELKEDIANMTKFTGNASDDKALNAALQNTYRNVKNGLNDATPGLRDLNERYADMVGAEFAVQHRAQILQRQALIKFAEKSTVAISLVGSIVTGNPLPILAGLGLVQLERVLSTTKARTSMAQWLSKSTFEEKENVFRKVPLLREAVFRVFGP